MNEVTSASRVVTHTSIYYRIIAKIPAGTKIKYAIGTAKEQVGAIESRPGGGLQILFEKFDDGWVLDTRPLP